MKNATEMKEITEAFITKAEAIHRQNVINFCEKYALRFEENANLGLSNYLLNRKAIPHDITAEEVCQYYREFDYTATIERYVINIRW